MLSEMELQIVKNKRSLKESDFVRRDILMRRTYTEFIELQCDFNVSAFVDNAISSYINCDIALYIITNKRNKRFYISFFKEGCVEDIPWHYVNTLGSGTVGDAIRKEGVSNFSFKILGKFDDFEIMKYLMLSLQKKFSEKAKPYLNSASINYNAGV